MARRLPPRAWLLACPFGREPRDECKAFTESPRLSAALDALKCQKSEIMDIFLEIGGCGRPQATAVVARAAGVVRWTTSPYCSMVPLGAIIDRLPAAAESGLDSHRIVANLVVTALWPKYWTGSIRVAARGSCGATPRSGTCLEVVDESHTRPASRFLRRRRARHRDRRARSAKVRAAGLRAP